jgi:hypothetical protein
MLNDQYVFAETRGHCRPHHCPDSHPPIPFICDANSDEAADDEAVSRNFGLNCILKAILKEALEGLAAESVILNHMLCLAVSVVIGKKRRMDLYRSCSDDLFRKAACDVVSHL